MGPEVFVGVLLERSLEMVISLLAIFKTGGACVPLDPAYPRERIQFILADTKAPVLVSTKKLTAEIQTDAKIIKLDSDWDLIAAESEKNLPCGASGEDAAYVIYTSGSTGQPKGVVITNHAIANHCIDCRKRYGLSSHDRVLQFSSFHFDASLEQILPALISGASLVVRDEEIWTVKEFGAKYGSSI